jgi:inosine-uridine nucleoside N-ribohydrolase
MGGALDVPGNTSPVAEFNCFADPYAAYQVLDGVKKGLFRLVMAPLDITTPHTIHFDQLIHTANGDAVSGEKNQKEEGRALTPLREFTSAMLIRVRGLMQSFGLPDEMEMHDPVAVWYAIANPVGAESEGWKTVPRVFAVERTGELTRGMCVVDRRYVSVSWPLLITLADRPHAFLSSRGTDEEDALRTKSSISSGKNEDGSAATTTKSTRAGAPEVIVGTPGKKVLETLLLGRVFGA